MADKHDGFTLIELLVVMSILALTMGRVISEFNSFNENQRLKQTALTLKNNLRLAQVRALSSLKPTAGCTQLDGYTVTFTDTSYQIQPRCDGAPVVSAAENFALPAGITFPTIPASFTFGVLTQGISDISGDTTITLEGVNRSFSLIISPSGDMSEGGYGP